MAKAAPKLGVPVRAGQIIVTDESPDDYIGDRYVQPGAPAAQPEPESSGMVRRVLGDGGVTLLKGAIGVPEAAVGLADIATGGMAGKVAENVFGFRPREAKAALDELYSPEQKAAFREVQTAANPNDSLVQRIADTGVAALRNPSTIVHAVGESLPAMGAGGVLARGVMAGARATSGAARLAAAGVGEGAVMAGSAAEQIRQETPDGLLTPTQAATAGGIGVAGTAFGMLGARVAKSLGIGDIDVLAAGGGGATPAMQKNFVRRVLEGAAAEGVLEELPQSVVEQVGQNFALGKPLDEGVDIAAVMGVLSGGAMGGGMGAMSRPKLPDSGPLARAANVAGATGAANAPTAPTAPTAPSAPIALTQEQGDQLLAHAQRRTQELTEAAKGVKATEEGADDTPARALTPEEQREQEFLQAAGGDVQALARAYGPPVQAPAPIDDGAVLARMERDQRRFEGEQRGRARAVEDDPIEQQRLENEAGLRRAAADKAAQRAASAPAEQPALSDLPFHDADDVLNPAGQPFKERFAARRRQANLPEPDAYDVLQVQGGYVLRRKSATAAPTEQPNAAAQVQPPANTQAAAEVDTTPVAAAPIASGNISTIDEGANGAATSPTNELPEPTEAQKKAGNYAKGHVRVGGLDLSIENPAGSVRRGTDRDGKAWENTLEHHYGYIRGTVGNDKDHVDLFVKPGTPQDYAGPVFVVDQYHPDSGKFDEHKALVGFDTEQEARDAYAANYAADWKGLKSITQMDFDGFKAWVFDGPKTAPLAAAEGASGEGEATDSTGADPGSVGRDGSGVPAVEGADAAGSGDADADGGAGEGGAGVDRDPAPKPIAVRPAGPGATAIVIDPSSAAAAPAASKRPKNAKAAADERAAKLADYFTPGNIVKSYGGHDRVVAFTPPDENGRWSVKVQEVRKEGDTWVDVGDPRDSRRDFTREHATEPDARQMQAGPVQRAKPVAGNPATAPAPAASANTIFTEDAANAARAILKRKLGLVSSGIDPEILQAGITLAGYHIERGARTIAAFAKAMIADLGDAARPYLKSWYMGVKYDPRAGAFEGMSTASDVEAFDSNAPSEETSAPAAAPAPTDPDAPQIVEHVTGKGKTLRGVVRTDLSREQAEAIDPYTFKKDGGFFIREKHLAEVPEAAAAPAAATLERPTAGLAELSQHLELRISEANGMPKDNPALRKLVEAFDGKPADPARMKVAQEALEVAIVRRARAIVAGRRPTEQTYQLLVDLYQSQPLLNVRTSTSIENQAYSTPAPLAFLASELAGITKQTSVLEPTAGNGMLLIAASTAKASVNELNSERADALVAQGFRVSRQDAAFAPLRHVGYPVDAVITNPPFGPIKNEAGESIKVKVDGYTLGTIDHLIAARALETMKDDGRATLILGAAFAENGRSNNDLIFLNWLYSHYTVTSHFEVDGGLYERQGAGWPVRVITIHGRKASQGVAPPIATIVRAKSWEEVYERFEQGLAAQSGRGTAAPAPVSDRPGSPDGTSPVPQPAAREAAAADRSGPGSGTPRAGNVSGERPGAVGDRGAVPAEPVGQRAGAQRPDAGGAAGNDGGVARPARPAEPARNSGGAGLADAENQFQARYVPRSARKDEGVLIPVNMAGPTQDSLNRLEDAVGDIDAFAARELGYDSVSQMHQALMGLQVDAVASAIRQIQQSKGVIIADQTGIGKGRQAAAVIRWAVRSGKVPVFVTVKPSLFTDMFGDLHDIGTDDIAPLILNSGEWIKGADDEKLFANRPAGHRRVLDEIAATGELPQGRNALFMTYSQINVDNVQRRAVAALSSNAVFVLDESHNAGGDSATGDFIKAVLDNAAGVVYLSATYAKRPDNMPVYFKTDIGDAVSDTDTLLSAMENGGLPLQTVVANNLVKSGQMFRRERSYDGVNIETRADTARRVDHERLSDATTEALRAIVNADRHFHDGYMRELQAQLKEAGERAMDAGNAAAESANHTEFSSVVHNFVRQLLLGLKAQTAADEAIASLKRGEKPMIAVENTMGSFLAEYAEANSIRPGDPLGNFDYRTVLTRALTRTRFYVHQKPNGDKERVFVELQQLDAETRAAYDGAQRVIDSLQVRDIPVSPIDWMRQQITNAGYTVAEITGRNLSVDYSDPKVPRLTALDKTEQKDKVRTTRLFNSGKLDALVLNVAGSTGISLHASEKFTDQRQRHMVVGQAAQDINIFMQMLGRIHRTGQVRLPKYTILNVDLPAEKRPTALLSKKMKSLNANTSSNTESATSVRAVDMLNKYGDAVIAQYLRDNQELAQMLGIDAGESDGSLTGPEGIARKTTGRLALMPVETQHAFYDEVEEQYAALIDYLNRTNQNELEPRTFDFDAKELRQEVLFEGEKPESPFGEDAVYGEYSVKAQGKSMTPDEVREALAEHLEGATSKAHALGVIEPLEAAFAPWLARQRGDQHIPAQETRRITTEFIQSHAVGTAWRVDINGDSFNAIVLNIRSTHKASGNPFALSKVQVTVAVNGALRAVTVPGTQFSKIEVSRLQGGLRQVDGLFEARATNERETAKIVTGNLLAAFGEITTNGTIISFTKSDGTVEQGILLPKKFTFESGTRGDYRLRTAADAFTFITTSTNENIDRFGINTRDQVVRVLPNGRDGITIRVPKSKARGGRYFLDAELREHTGDFVSSGSFMNGTIDNREAAERALAIVMRKQALYVIPSMAEEAKGMFGGDPEQPPPTTPDGDGRPRASRSDDVAASSGQHVSQVQALVSAVTSRWANAPEVVVVQNFEDRRVPAEIRAEERTLRSQGAAGLPEGFFHVASGTVFMAADRLGGDGDTLRVLMHEALGHYGLRRVYGADLGTVLDRLAVLNAGKVRQMANQLGYDYDKPSERRLAAEEVLAYMAQTSPEVGWVRRAVATIRTWLREHVPGFGRMGLSDAEIIRDFILPARRAVKGGAQATAAADSSTQAAALYSRPLQAALDAGVNNVRDWKLPAGYVVGDFMSSVGAAPGRLGWWHKTVGTQHNLAEREPAFKRVYDGVQSFLNDVSYYATEAADLAPRVLPKLDSIRDVFKSPLSPEDTKALSAPVFEGTLAWGRDSKGRARRMEEVEDELIASVADGPLRDGATEAEQLTHRLEGKARLLLQGEHVTAEVLRMWQGLPLEQYEAIIEGKFERDYMKPGVVFTDDELRQHFKLSDTQIELYREFRAAVDKSLTDLTITNMLRYGGKELEGLRDQAMNAETLEQAATLLRDKFFALAKADPGNAERLNADGGKMIDLLDRTNDLIARGYAPLSRFGQYTLDVLDADGKRVYFSLFESAAERSRMARQMARQFPGATLSQGTVSDLEYRLFAGVSPETLELFGEMLGLEGDGSDEQSKAFQTYLKVAKSTRSSMKRLIQRKGTAGFSEDAGRVLAGFVYSNARQSASNLHMGEVDRAVNEIPQGDGQLKDAAMRLREYVKNPQEEAQGFRAILFAQYLGGSIASAMVNATQPFAVTLPYLSQFGGAAAAARQMTAAVRDATRGATGDAALDAALKKAEEDGIVSPQEVHALQAQAMGRAQLTSGDGTRMGNASAQASNALSKLSLAWGKVFGVAEQFNRRVTFIAAYRTAVANGKSDPSKFAERAVAETQFTYNKGNKPRWARGAVGSILFTFKQYSVNYVELLHRMATAGEPGSEERKAGQRAALLALAVLFLLAGGDGLPFVGDIEDVIDGAMQRMGYNFSSKQRRKEFLAQQLGKDAAEFLNSGVSGLPGVPIDVSGRLGLGNLIPGTGLLQKKTDHTRDLMEIAGAGGDFAKRAAKAAEQLAGGQALQAANTISPVAWRNVTKAYDMAVTGQYRDDRGYKVVDTTGGEALAKAIGFQPRDVAVVQQATMEAQRSKSQYILVSTEIRGKMARAIYENDEDLKADARQDLEQWNRQNPEQPIRMNMPAVLRRVREMRKTKADRVADTAPKAIRQEVRKQIAEELA